MNANRPTSADAIHVYLLALAYLHDVRIGDPSTDSTWYARKKWVGVFYIWQRTQPLDQETSIALVPVGNPVAMCIYKKAKKMWKVDLGNGENLTLYDSGNVWEIDPVEKPLAPKKRTRNQDRKRRTT